MDNNIEYSEILKELEERRKYFLDKIHYNDPNVHRFCKDYDRYRYVAAKEYTYMLNQYKGIDNLPPWVREDKLTILLHQYKLCNTITEIIQQKQLQQALQYLPRELSTR